MQSEWVRFVRAQRKRRLEQDPVGRRTFPRRVPLVPDHQLGELAREELQVSREGVRRAAAGTFVLKRVEARADVPTACELIPCERVATREVPGGPAIDQTIRRYPTGQLKCRVFLVELLEELGLQDERLLEALLERAPPVSEVRADDTLSRGGTERRVAA